MQGFDPELLSLGSSRAPSSDWHGGPEQAAWSVDCVRGTVKICELTMNVRLAGHRIANLSLFG
jgi:hypothetical protein